MNSIFEQLGCGQNPVVLAPLAGVSDQPFRRVCQRLGADLTYVEMLSATALVYRSARTLEMCHRHKDEPILGVQLTGRSAVETEEAIRVLEELPFDTVDINMGCPVQKIVKVGCGSAILKDPVRVHETVKRARIATKKPLSAKIRIGWDHHSINGVEVARAIEDGGADWLTVHGRTRSDDYGAKVDLDEIAKIKESVRIPVLGNGNIFSIRDAQLMQTTTRVDGVMVSRGSLGNPWVFEEIKGLRKTVTLEDWVSIVTYHLDLQSEQYGLTGVGALCMRKHLLWYAKGWPGSKLLRDHINKIEDLNRCKNLIEEFAENLRQSEVNVRADISPQGDRFLWDPKFDMDRKLDRGVGDDCCL